MIKIELYDDDFTIFKFDLDAKTYPILNSIDCKMRIIVENKIFYDDWICPLELYYQFKLWFEDVKKGNLKDFSHETIETDDNPIILFSFDKEVLQWTIDGTFKKYYEEKTFITIELLSLFE